MYSPGVSSVSASAGTKAAADDLEPHDQNQLTVEERGRGNPIDIPIGLGVVEGNIDEFRRTDGPTDLAQMMARQRDSPYPIQPPTKDPAHTRPNCRPAGASWREYCRACASDQAA